MKIEFPTLELLTDFLNNVIPKIKLAFEFEVEGNSLIVGELSPQDVPALLAHAGTHGGVEVPDHVVPVLGGY